MPKKHPPHLKLWHLVLCLAWCLTCGAAWSASFDFVQPQLENIGDAESIPEGTVTALTQDARGFIWIGTQKGLLRYDGYRFRRFTHLANDPASLAGDYVLALWAAPDGRVWVGSNSDGLSVFDPASERFERFSHDPARADSLAAGRVLALAGDAQGGLWIATDNGLCYRQTSGSGGFTHYRHDPANPASLLDNRVRSLLLDRQARLWVGTVSGLQLRKPDGKGFETIAGSAPDPAAKGGVAVQALFQAQDGKLWLGSAKHGAAWLMPDAPSGARKLHWLPLESGKPAAAVATSAVATTTVATAAPRPEGLSHAWVRGIAQVAPNRIWLATYGGGINVVDASDGRVLQHLRHDPALSSSLALDSVKPLLLDRSGLLWIGTWGGGLQRFNTHNDMVRLLRHGQNPASHLSHPNIRSMLELANGQILFGTNGNGIDIFSPQSGLTGGYRATPGQRGSLPDGTILALAQTKDGSIWAGTQLAGIVRLQPGSKEWQSIPALPGAQVRRFLEARDGSLWVATDRGAARWQAGQSRFEPVPDQNGTPMTNAVITLAQDREGRIWAGSDNGLWVMPADGKGLQAIPAAPLRASGLVSGYVTGLLVDQTGRLWLATDKGMERLLRWDGKNAEFEHISDLLGQSGQALGANLMQDRSGRIWTEAAIIDPTTMRLVSLSKADGTDSGASWLGAYGKTRDGLLLFGGTLGVTIINPALLKGWEHVPPVVVSDLAIDGKPAPPGALLQGKGELVLSPMQRNFAVEFAALDYSDPNSIRYQYRLQGYDAQWIDTTPQRRSAAYGNLWPGQYTLQVRGSNRLGVWNPHTLNLPIRVLPAFWQTWWCLLLVLLLCAGLIWGMYRWRTRRLNDMIDLRTADILKLGEVGRALTSTLDPEQVFARMYGQVRRRLDTGVFLIGIYDESSEQIHFVYRIENARRQEASVMSIHETDRPAVWCIREQRELVVANSKQLLEYVGTVLPPSEGAATETIVYFPLMLEQRVLGCLSVQSLQADAYDQNQLEFLRVMASYTAIALSNTTAHGDLARAHRHLKETQSQLIQSEKMASLGQLVANVAHEINTPTSAIKASGGNITDALATLLDDLPKVLKLLDAEDEHAFMDLILHAKQHAETLNSREERALKRQLQAQLTEAGIGDAEHCADTLAQLPVRQVLPEWLRLLRHPQAGFVLHCANSVVAMLHNADNINLAVGRVARVISALSAFAGHQSASEAVATDLAEALETVLTLYQNQINQGTTLVREFAVIEPVRCLPGELNQVWLALIQNALQAMNYHGTLTLGIRREGNEAIVSVRDTGCGIAAHLQAKIFEAFFTTKPAGEGSGIGLNIAKKIVEKHHGRIEVQSSVGVGSTFSVHLPYSA